MVAIWLVMLVALVGLGSLAAVVFAIVYAIANKKPGVALAAVLLPLGAITTVGVLTALFVGRASYQVQGPVHADIHYAIDAPPSPPSPPSFPTPKHEVNPVQVDPDLAIWVFVLAAVLVASFLAFRKRSCSGGKWNFGKALAVGMLLFLGAKFFFASASPRVEVVHGQQKAAADHAEQARIDVENAERKAIEAKHAVEDAQRKIEEAAQEKAAKEHGIEFKSMQELWEKLNQPRIKLESVDEGASMEAGVNGKVVKIEASEAGEAELVVPISGETPESLARSLARLERMVERVSAMADQVSDAGTLVGKAMVALSDTLDAQKSPALVRQDSATLKTASGEKAIPAIEVAHAVVTAPSEQPDAPQPASTSDSAPSIVELEIDQSKMDEYGVSERELFQALDKLGLQLGAEHVNDELRKVRAIGGPDSQPVSNLMDTVIAKVGVEGREVRLNDIAKSNGKSTVKRTVDGVRPDWVDVPAKRVGDVWREVLVTDEFATDEECRHQADGRLFKLTYEYIRQMAGYPGDFVDSRATETWSSESPVYPALTRMGIGVDYIRREIAKDEYTETVERSFGPMRKNYVQVEFSPSVQAELRQRWEEYLRQERFAMVGMGAGSVLGLLGIAFGLLKVDTWTKGYYTKRLFLGVPAAIIGMLGLLGLVVS